VSEISNIEISAAMYLSEADFTLVTEGLASTAPVVALIALPNAVFAMIVLVMTVAAPVVLLTIPIPVFVTVAAYRAQIAGRANSSRTSTTSRRDADLELLQERHHRRRRLPQPHRHDVQRFFGGAHTAAVEPWRPGAGDENMNGEAPKSWRHRLPRSSRQAFPRYRH